MNKECMFPGDGNAGFIAFMGAVCFQKRGGSYSRVYHHMADINLHQQ